MIASVNSNQEQDAAGGQVDDALGIGLDRLDQRRREVGGEGRLQALVGDHLQRVLLPALATIRWTKLPPLEALPWRP